MNGIFAAAIPVFGLLACLFVGFILLSSESRSGERVAYMFFGVGVAWLLASGTVLWPKVSHAKAVPIYQSAAQAQPEGALRAAPAPQAYAYRGYGAHPYAYAQPYRYAYAYQQPSYPYGYYHR
jgi:hypothetical protein